MKKNVMLRVASALLVAVLLSTCVISGTFAKYVTSANAQDSARVAKWGVVVSATAQSFAKAYDSDTTGVSFNTVVSSNDDDLLAPGTEGALGALSITGTPEVAVTIDCNATLDLTGWVISGVEYCPVVFTVEGATYSLTGMGGSNEYASIAELELAVENAFNVLDKLTTDKVIAPNTNLAGTISASWAWAFSTSTENDKKDTALGNLAADGNAPRIAFTCDVTVTQVD